MLVQDFEPGCSLDALRDAVLGWSTSKASQPEAWFHLQVPELNPKDVHEVVFDLLACRAIEGRDDTKDVDVRSEPWIT